ncbi:MAG: hypothetical protein ACJ798_04900 [Phenylobacterium sp.]
MSPDEPVATGDRRETVHFERDPDQLVRARFLHKPDGPPPPDEHTGRVDAGAEPVEAGPPIEDVAVAPDEPSAWDARPPDDDQNHESGPGH